MKKFMKVDQLENRVASLQAENAKLTLNNAVLESEKRSMYAKENEYKKRIRYLEEVMKCNGWDFSTDHTQW
jgi:FtsZ-binding cell division protein ZapB